jgi:hypothetical protein
VKDLTKNNGKTVRIEPFACWPFFEEDEIAAVRTLNFVISDITVFLGLAGMNK